MENDVQSTADKFVKATREGGMWDKDDTNQLNITAPPETLNAFRSLAWMLRISHSQLLKRLVAAEIQSLDESGAIDEELKRQRAAKSARFKGEVPATDALDAVAERFKR